MLKTIALICFVISLCLGCTQRFAVTFKSDPYGATLYDGRGQKLGLMPLTLYYTPTDDAIKSGNVTLAPTTARWVSGATADGPRTLYAKNGTSQKYTFIRPVNAPGQELDLKAELLLMQYDMGTIDRQMQFNQEQLQIIQQQIQQQTQPLQQQQFDQTHCKTRMINGQIQTYCW
ncbi:MAG: hypothetical protein FD174_3085 [Geobacteraceae bacterium]|nr:MAG: hypothetical protein FD174_3085 [Geobacteraceae bacterium]